ncbi:uncharacterized protein TNIN_198271 [Trichonephila inaurata madagascariensis]|uniref:Uncharacterized protein n=1 Tax=Trichonephila inaurata madagascariensis TaxID=2747483 RepID=A0A8X7CGT5_9ARAC|nr:uncharacterized protein TNIN_198271 [Trichonephila inaurata madagascariensis]
MAFFDRVPVLSLRQMAMTKLAITVCCDPEILNFVKNYGCVSFVFPSKESHLYLDVKSLKEEAWIRKDLLIIFYFSDLYVSHALELEALQSNICKMRKNILPFARWEELVKERIFLLPQLLKHELLDVVRSLSIEIDKWIKYHSQDWQNFSEIARSALYDFQWNSLGKIDLVRTASALIVNETLNIKDRYILASLYGLIDKLPIGKKVPDEIVQMYSKLAERGIKVQKEWDLSREGIQFKYFMRQNLFTEVSSEQKVLFLNSALLEECLQYNDFLFYMSKLGNEERKAVFKTSSLKILQLLLDWPLQREFLNAAEHLLPYFTEKDFILMLNVILYERIMLCRKDFNYIDLLKEFWSLSPSHLKESIKTYPMYDPLMFIINLPVNEIFPNEKLLQNYKNDNLTFRCCGVWYKLKRRQNDRCIKNCKYDHPPAFINTSLFYSLKRKYNLCSSGPEE